MIYLRRFIQATGTAFLVLVTTGLLLGQTDDRPTSLNKQKRAIGDFHEWSFEEMQSGADVIVIASALSTEALEFDDSIASGFRGQESVTCLSSKLKVNATLKGEPLPKTIECVHLRWNRGIILVRSNFVSFKPEMKLPELVKTEFDDDHVVYSLLPDRLNTIKPEYMLFLRRRADGRFEPLTGQVNARASVFILNGIDIAF